MTSIASLERAYKNAGHGYKGTALKALQRARHEQLRREVGLGPTLLWWPIGKPLPEGASLSRQEPSHHSHYGQLIVVGGARG